MTSKLRSDVGDWEACRTGATVSFLLSVILVWRLAFKEDSDGLVVIQLSNAAVGTRYIYVLMLVHSIEFSREKASASSNHAMGTVCTGRSFYSMVFIAVFVMFIVCF